MSSAAKKTIDEEQCTGYFSENARSAAKKKRDEKQCAGYFSENARGNVCDRLENTEYLQHSSENFWHGRAYTGPPKKPMCTWESNKPPRDDHGAPIWLKASEFEDDKTIIDWKCEQLAQLMKLSKKTVLYTGAGISASVVGQAARSGQNTVGWKTGDKRLVKPTFTHFALAHMARVGYIDSWVQQNHDGLPQKAGYPQENINEIHGSWFNPGNPVVKYSGSLHDRTWPWMMEAAETADLVIVIGTSLSGLSADCVATKTAERSRYGASLGTVCINLQQTAVDGDMSLRLFGKSDDVLRKLAHKLGLGSVPTTVPSYSSERAVPVPYDKDGIRLPPGSKEPKMYLDFSDGAKIKLAPGHNIQGARQPCYMHIGAKMKTKYRGVMREPGDGTGRVARRELYSYVLLINYAQMHLGVWWLDAAKRGALEAIPVVNLYPVFENSGKKSKNIGNKSKAQQRKHHGPTPTYRQLLEKRRKQARKSK